MHCASGAINTGFVWTFLCFMHQFSLIHSYIYINDAMYIFVFNFLLLFTSNLARTGCYKGFD